MFEADEALPAAPDDESHVSELTMAELMALADADAAEVLPAGPEPPALPSTSVLLWPPAATTIALGAAGQAPASRWRWTPRCSRAVTARNLPGG